MITDNFVKSEMLAEAHIDSVEIAKQLLLQGQVNDCQKTLSELKVAMQKTLAIGELYDLRIFE